MIRIILPFGFQAATTQNSCHPDRSRGISLRIAKSFRYMLITLVCWLLLGAVTAFASGQNAAASSTVPVAKRTDAKAEDIYAFSEPVSAARFAYLTREFRCLVCQNQSLSESNAPLAQDLRKTISILIKQGRTDPEIKTYLVQRYGDFVMYRPGFTSKTVLLWLGPFALLLFGLGIVVFMRWR